MSTRFEKIDAQRMAFKSQNIKLRHLISPVELEHLFRSMDDMWVLSRENQQLKAEIERLKNGIPTQDPK